MLHGSALERAEHFLQETIARIHEWGSARRLPGGLVPPCWEAYEAVAYLANRSKLTIEQREDVAKRLRDEANAEDQYVDEYRQWLGQHARGRICSDYRNPSACSASGEAAVLRTVSSCNITGAFNDHLIGFADDEYGFCMQPCKMSGKTLSDFFCLSRSDVAIALVGNRYADNFAGFCAYRCPWEANVLPNARVVDARSAAMMLFTAERLGIAVLSDEHAARAIEAVYLMQQADGSWLMVTDIGDCSSIISTAVAIHGLALWQPEGCGRRVARGAEWLLTRQYPDGSWREKNFHNCYTTVLVLDAISLADGQVPLTFSRRQIEGRSNRGSSAITPFDPPVKLPGCDDAPPLDRYQANVLQYLADTHPVLCVLDDIEGATEFSRNTVCAALKSLMDDGYAIRPHGNRKGATATKEGRTIAAKLALKLSAV
jgi:hypothetical protein